MKNLFLAFLALVSINFATLQAQDIELQMVEIPELERLLVEQGNGPLVINFWATWCKPCVQELPQIEALHDQFPDQYLDIKLLSLDFEDRIATELLPFLEEKKLRSEVYFLSAGNPNDWIDKVDPRWSGAIPFTIVLDETREIRWIHEGLLPENELKTILVDKFKLELK